MRSNIPGVTATASPKEIGRAVAHHMCERLPGETWQVTASGIKTTEGDQTTEIRLRRLRPSQTGIGAFFEPLLTVRDRSLRAWRRQHPELAPLQDDRMIEGAVYALDPPWQTPVVLTTDDPGWGHRHHSIDDLISHLIDTTLPVRERLRSGRGLLDLPDTWLSNGWLLALIEYAFAQDEPDVGMTLLARSGEVQREGFRRGQERARLGLERDGEASSSLGYSVARLTMHYGRGDVVDS